jgi:hypothetical protein
MKLDKSFKEKVKWMLKNFLEDNKMMIYRGIMDFFRIY